MLLSEELAKNFDILAYVNRLIKTAGVIDDVYTEKARKNDGYYVCFHIKHEGEYYTPYLFVAKHKDNDPLKHYKDVDKYYVIFYSVNSLEEDNMLDNIIEITNISADTLDVTANELANILKLFADYRYNGGEVRKTKAKEAIAQYKSMIEIQEM